MSLCEDVFVGKWKNTRRVCADGRGVVDELLRYEMREVRVGAGELKYEWARFQISCWTHSLIRIPVRRDLATKREKKGASGVTN